MVRTLARCGANVVVHFNQSSAAATKLRNEVKALGRQAMTVQADITQEKSVMAMRDAVNRELGEPDIIVNNAVIKCAPWMSVLETPVASYRSQFESCVLQNALMAKAFVPAMKSKRWGRVIGINTECTIQCTPTQSAYVSGKGGMDRLLRVLAREVGEFQITVNQVAPGWMISDKYRASGETNPEYEKNVPLRRRGEDQDIANLVAFLASDLAGYISGQYISVSGGNVMPTI